MSEELTNEDFVLIDETEEAVRKGKRKKAKILYMKAKPEAKKLIRPFLNPKIFFETPKGLQEDKVRTYINAREEGNEVGMKSTYRSANPITKKTIDELFD